MVPEVLRGRLFPQTLQTLADIWKPSLVYWALTFFSPQFEHSYS